LRVIFFRALFRANDKRGRLPRLFVGGSWRAMVPARRSRVWMVDETPLKFIDGSTGALAVVPGTFAQTNHGRPILDRVLPVRAVVGPWALRLISLVCGSGWEDPRCGRVKRVSTPLQRPRVRGMVAAVNRPKQLGRQRGPRPGGTTGVRDPPQREGPLAMKDQGRDSRDPAAVPAARGNPGGTGPPRGSAHPRPARPRPDCPSTQHCAGPGPRKPGPPRSVHPARGRPVSGACGPARVPGVGPFSGPRRAVVVLGGPIWWPPSRFGRNLINNMLSILISIFFLAKSPQPRSAHGRYPRFPGPGDEGRSL